MPEDKGTIVFIDNGINTIRQRGEEETDNNVIYVTSNMNDRHERFLRWLCPNAPMHERQL